MSESEREILTEIKQKIDSVEDPTLHYLLMEAFNSYKGTAYRSAVVSIWVAFLYDVLVKFREQTEGRNNNIGNCLQRVTNFIEKRPKGNWGKHGFIESEIFDCSTKEFKFLTTEHIKTLNEIRSNRHECAHMGLISDTVVFKPEKDFVYGYITFVIDSIILKTILPVEEIRKRFIKYIQDVKLDTSVNQIRSEIRNKFTIKVGVDTKIALFKCALQYNVGSDKWKHREKKIYTICDIKCGFLAR